MLKYSTARVVLRDEAERIAMRLMGANLTGHDSHGVLRTSRYVDWLERGLFHPGRKVHIGFDSDALCILDGQYGFGQTIGEQAVRLGLDKAAKSGAAVVALNNTGHLGRIGDWAEMGGRRKISCRSILSMPGAASWSHLLAVPKPDFRRRLSVSACPVPTARRWFWISPLPLLPKARCWSPTRAANRCRKAP